MGLKELKEYISEEFIDKLGIHVLEDRGTR